MAAVTAESSERRRGGRLVLAALVLATFAANVTPIVVTPFLLDIAHDLGTDLAALGTFLAVGSISWGMVSIFAGAASDRLGRRPIILAGLAGLAIFPFGMAATWSYWLALLWRLVGGVGGGMFMGSAFAAAADSLPAAERGRALGWIVTGQSLALLVGVPLIAYLGAFVGWRGALAAQGVVMLLAMLLTWLAVPGRPPHPAGEAAPQAASIRQLLRPRVVALLAANTMERFCYGGVAVYLATFLLTTYGVSLEVVAIGLAVVASGNLVGTLVGGELSDRWGRRSVLAAGSLLATALLALPLLLWQPGLAISIGVGFAYTVANAIGRPSLVASVSEVSNEARGALLGANMTFASFGWLGSQAFGGWLIAVYGFGAFGWATAIAGLAGTLLALLAPSRGRSRAAA